MKLRWTHVNRSRGGQAPCGRPHRKLKLESTDVILFTRISSLDGIKSGNFSAISISRPNINY